MKLLHNVQCAVVFFVQWVSASFLLCLDAFPLCQTFGPGHLAFTSAEHNETIEKVPVLIMLTQSCLALTRQLKFEN